MRKLILLALSLLGLFDSTYLWWVYTSPSRPMVCVGTGCDVVRASAYAQLWGLALPVYGVVMYAALALLILAGYFPAALGQSRVRQLTDEGGGLERGIGYALAAISGAGFLASLYLSYLEGLVLRAWCAWCVVSALTVTAIFLLAMLGVLRPVPPAAPVEAKAALGRGLAVLMAAVAVGTPAFYWLSRHGEVSASVAPSAEVLARHLVRPDSHAAGNLQSPVTVVEFGDFQCPACGHEQAVVREIREKYGSQVRFVFRHFPISSLHMYAEEAAEASECAAEQGKFWEAADKFYDRQDDLSEPALERYAAELGLDVGKFNPCLASGAMTARVRRDVEDARALGVSQTPTFFIGQHLAAGAIDFAKFYQLLDQELASRGVAPSASAKLRASSDPASGAGLLAKGGASEFAQYQKQGSETACSEDEAKKRQPALIDTARAQELFANGSQALFVDVRTPNEFNKARIAGAVNVPVEDVEARWSRLPKSREIVLYESGRSSGDICAASRAVGRVLLSHGFSFDEVKVYQDGLAAWQKAGLPVAGPLRSGH